MATDEEKKQNKLRLTALTLTGLTKGVWDVLGKSAFALTPAIGEDILLILEKEMGLEIHGETSKDVLEEISRLFVDEFGAAKKIDIDMVDDETIKVNVTGCLDRFETQKLIDNGVEKPFICPIMNACQAALKRLGKRAHEEIKVCPDGNCEITYDIIN